MARKNQKNQQYVIGVDGGATKTVAALADLRGKILKVAKSGPSNPRNVGIKTAAENIAKAINKVRTKGILVVFVGLAAIEEEYKQKKGKIKQEILEQKGIPKDFKRKIKIGTDQLVAFRAGTDEKNGVTLIAGTGCVAHGWREGKEAKAGGWGWLADEGSAFWVGKKVFKSVLKDMDDRGSGTILTKMVSQRLKVSSPEKLAEKIYGEEFTPHHFSSKNGEGFIEIISSLSILCDKAGKRRDKVAEEILKEGALEAALAINTVVKKLNFQKEKFPLVLVGSMFKSEVFLKTVKLYVKRLAPKAIFIRPKKPPVTGALKLAIEPLDRFVKL